MLEPGGSALYFPFNGANVALHCLYATAAASDMTCEAQPHPANTDLQADALGHSSLRRLLHEGLAIGHSQAFLARRCSLLWGKHLPKPSHRWPIALILAVLVLFCFATGMALAIQSGVSLLDDSRTLLDAVNSVRVPTRYVFTSLHSCSSKR